MYTWPSSYDMDERRSPFDHFISMLGICQQPTNSEESVMGGVFQVYLDETGTHRKHDPSAVISVAGLMGPHTFWERFNHDWTSVLSLRDPRIVYWHTSKAADIPLMDSPSMRMDPEQIQKKSLELAAVLHSHRGCMRSFCVEMSVGDHMQEVAGKLKVPGKAKRIGDPDGRFICDPVFMLMRRALRESLGIAESWSKAIYGDREFVIWNAFEENESEESNQLEFIVSVYMLRKSMPKDERSKIGPAIFLPSKGALGQTTLQAADLYACMYYRNNASRLYGVPPPPEWEMLGKIPGDLYRISADDLRETVERINGGGSIW